VPIFGRFSIHKRYLYVPPLQIGAPDVIAGEVDVFPAQREIGEEAVWNVFDLSRSVAAIALM
jgi:hypothetical protein